MPAAAPIRLSLADGRHATLSLAEASTAVAVGETDVSSYDLGGRPYALRREDWTWRRSLDGRLLRKGRTTEGARLLEIVSALEGASVLEAAREECRVVASAVRRDEGAAQGVLEEARRRLERIVSMDTDALARDAQLFATIYRPLGILPPDQYLALVVQVTEGCSWNGCTFCDLYRGTPFRVKSLVEFEAHVAAVRDYFGEAIGLRRSIFLADANALCVSHERLLPLLASLTAEFPVAPAELSPRQLRHWLSENPWGVSGLYSFVDAWSGHTKPVAQLREYAQLGLRRVYVGLETGAGDLLAWLEKPGAPSDAVELVQGLHEAGMAAGVIVLLGAGGEEYSDSHVRGTADALRQMQLGPDDLLYFSELVEHERLSYARRAAELRPLSPSRCAEQRQAIAASLTSTPGKGPRVASYDIREYVY